MYTRQPSSTLSATLFPFTTLFRSLECFASLAMTNNFRLPLRPLPRPQIPEQIGRDLPHLDLFGALGDAIPPVVPINMLERLVARIADAAMDLHRAIGGFADERSAERRVGEGCVSTCRSRWSPYT